MSKKSLPQWLSYIESLHSKTIALGLERVGLVAQKLGVLTFQCPVITVAGTNGKGSCVAFLEAILSAAGYVVGTYTSPHLLRFNERIRIANQHLLSLNRLNRSWPEGIANASSHPPYGHLPPQPEKDRLAAVTDDLDTCLASSNTIGEEVDDLSLLHAFEQVDLAREEIELTYFEFTTLAAFVLFKAVKPDVLILEVGLGGRLDAVNLIEPDVSVITTIALDHMDWLGDTREAIGYEKAGIFRANKPAICGDFDPPSSVFEVAEKLSASLHCVGRDFSYTEEDSSWTWVHKETVYAHLPLPQLPLQNAAAALMVIHCLQNRLQVSLAAIVQGLEQAFLKGRFQRFSKPIDTVLDVAHNPASATYLAKRLNKFPTTGMTRAVVSILSDKDIEETLRPLLEIVSIWYVAPLDLPRGSTTKNMANCLQKLGVAAYDIHSTESVVTAYEQAVYEAKTQDRILVFGSFHTVASVLPKVY